MHTLVTLTHNFATGTTESRASTARESDDGRRLRGSGYPLNFGGMSKGRLNQFNLVCGVRGDPSSLLAVTVCRSADALLQSQIFFRRVGKAAARLEKRAERIAELRKTENERRAWVYDVATGEYTECELIDVKKGDRFYLRNPDGARDTDHDWLAKSNGFWYLGYLAAVYVDRVE